MAAKNAAFAGVIFGDLPRLLGNSCNTVSIVLTMTKKGLQ